jgi:pimeloyl-ACP methyl ester carboxylesterase
MHFTTENTESSVVTRDFDIEVAGERVPGVVWSPVDASGPHPLVLMGHGGSQHKKVDTLAARARRYASKLGFVVAAIDAPGHGDRVTPEEAAAFRAAVQKRIAERGPDDADVARGMAERAAQAVPEWRATLDALRELDIVGVDSPIGYWGVSMGTAIGVPLLAAEPRINAAVLGLAGLGRNNTAFAEAAAKVTIPVEFAFQWDDEIAGHEAGIALFDALGSEQKTMHVNPGGHLGIPIFERDSWERFFTRHLTGRAAPAPVG